MIFVQFPKKKKPQTNPKMYNLSLNNPKAKRNCERGIG